jgi:CRP-like cAMP-binding protein
MAANHAWAAGALASGDEEPLGVRSREVFGRDSALHRAWSASIFAEWPEAAGRAVRDTAHEQSIERGQNLYRELVQPRFVMVAVIVNGLVRVYVTSRSGRRMTVRYLRQGNVLGLPAMLLDGAPVGVDVVTPGSILSLDPVTIRRLAQQDGRISWSIAREVASELRGFERLLSSNVFCTIRERLAQHLLELVQPRGEELVVHSTQQELADSIGSVREVVARVVVGLRREGLIDRRGDAVIVVDPDELARVARGGGD